MATTLFTRCQVTVRASFGRPLSPGRKVDGETIWGLVLRVRSREGQRSKRFPALTGLFPTSTRVLMPCVTSVTLLDISESKILDAFIKADH